MTKDCAGVDYDENGGDNGADCDERESKVGRGDKEQE